MAVGISENNPEKNQFNVPDLAFTAKPHNSDSWQYLQRALAELGITELSKRQQLIRRLLHDSGVADHGHGVLRPWVLDPIPLAIPSQQWQVVERGLQQRAELLSCLYQDIYGSQRVLRQGLLPAEAVLADPGFLRSCVGQPSSTGHFRLPVHTADLAQDTAGHVWVLNDSLQRLGGLGYALENRIVLSRVLPSLFREARVHRLAQFFRVLRQCLQSSGDTANSCTVLLTPGLAHPDYFEHAYLANYLGYPLVQGNDLTVRDGGVFLRSLDGLQPVDVILRWNDDRDCDSLELGGQSRLGVAGLLQAVRQQRVDCVNPLGSAVLENPALSIYLPALCRALLGEELRLPSVETLWCGDPAMSTAVLDQLQELVVHERSGSRYDGRCLASEQLSELRQAIKARPWGFTARRPFTPAANPVLRDGTEQSLPVLLRTFLVATADDYLALPGGLGGIIADSEARDGKAYGIGKDVWVLASEPVQPLSLLTTERTESLPLRISGVSSRVAENLFWLGRYAERSESMIRLLRVMLLELLEPDPEQGAELAYLPDFLRALRWLAQPAQVGGGEMAAPSATALDHAIAELLLDAQTVGSLVFNLQAMLNAARTVRERISPDLWRVIAGIDDDLQQLQTVATHATDAIGSDPALLNAILGQLNQLLTASAAFNGLTLDSMHHGQGWRFLMIGRRLERAQQQLRLLRALLVPGVIDSPLLQALLNVCDSLMTYRDRYRIQIRTDAVLELLLLDEANPRALGYQLRHLQLDIDRLPGQQALLPHRSTEQRISLDVLTRLRLVELPELLAIDSSGRRWTLDTFSAQLGQQLAALGEALADGYFRHADRPQQLVSYQDQDEQ